MAGFNLEIPEDYLKELLDHDFDSIAKEALNDTAPILEKSIKAKMRAAVQHEGDSEMIASIRTNKPQKTKTDAYVVTTYPTGYSQNTFRRGEGKKARRYPVSNALKAIWLEYGRIGQTPRPWLAPAIAAIQDEVLNRIQKKWEEMTGV